MYFVKYTYIGVIVLASLFPSGPSSRILSDDPACLMISIACAEGPRCKGKNKKLVAIVSSSDPNLKPTFKWCLSAGRIVKGQGTAIVEIDTNGLKEEVVTVVVIVGGGPKFCSNVASYMIDLSNKSGSGAATPNNGMHPTAISVAFIR